MNIRWYGSSEVYDYWQDAETSVLYGFNKADDTCSKIIPKGKGKYAYQAPKGEELERIKTAIAFVPKPELVLAWRGNKVA
jgi:hypothetical protein